MDLFVWLASSLVFLSLIGILLAWTQKIEDEWDSEDPHNWDWHR